VLEDVGDELDEYEYENMDDYVGGDEALEKAGGGGESGSERSEATLMRSSRIINS